jgi:hypothetical protein
MQLASSVTPLHGMLAPLFSVAKHVVHGTAGIPMPYGLFSNITLLLASSLRAVPSEPRAYAVCWYAHC